jgi:hypothetical protein
VYALAAYALLNANINQIANRIDRKIETVERSGTLAPGTVATQLCIRSPQAVM